MDLFYLLQVSNIKVYPFLVYVSSPFNVIHCLVVYSIHFNYYINYSSVLIKLFLNEIRVTYGLNLIPRLCLIEQRNKSIPISLFIFTYLINIEVVTKTSLDLSLRDTI